VRVRKGGSSDADVEGQKTSKQGQEAGAMVPNKPHTPDPEAQQLYLKGREFVANAAKLQDYGKTRRETLEKAIEYFEQAVSKDPNYAAPYVSLAESYLSLQFFSGAKGTETFPKVEAAASKAIEMDEKLAEAHEILARAKFSHDWDWAGAEKKFRRARELNPSVRGFPFDSYAGLLAATGRFDESVAEIKRINELDPNPSRSHFDLGFVLYWARRYDEAIEHFQKAIQANSAAPAHFFLGFAYAQKSRFRRRSWQG
jgi:tetratricopeptide (TPR) repeat protein